MVGALLRCPLLAVLALRRIVRLASHPAMTAKMHQLPRDSPSKKVSGIK
jgi:hypothetical protein